ncbi:delta(1)-pyrroline-2-carboxylate reductase family protein [Massilia sp. YIM B02769]|uniref:bifunctional Delta(1)-pyrroline-2-carboxylate/Delta(1)-piperideine-2- carboxylate reductase n=1 Tax=Massilia sp. YIM B02769 TaxID=3050129 RepID=UPI0025B67902|nr:bifunctional Delta(1)-pyrroline-2-carboxylate/Delta(1)-piperideine-2-carboxylate reductase [Massilia sp. YIM B02769]MDN4060267.1 delta(1)-pyrroline-2-carboxylate reductase family protein [Massilia sp. YIM B02769]
MTDFHPAAMHSGIAVYHRAQTAALLDFAELVDAIAVAAEELEAGAIRSPERLVVPLGAGAVMLSMPAAAQDIAIHKLVNVHPGNPAIGLPAIHGAVTICDTATGQVRCVLDGPEVTGRRTAAVSMLAIRRLLPQAPRQILIVGTGVQARHHVQALHALYPQAEVWVQARTRDAATRFCDAHQALHGSLRPRASDAPAMDVVITLTTSLEPVYDEAPRPGCLVIGVGAFRPEMAELGATTLHGSELYADDPPGARHEAGDLLRAGIDWSRVGSLGALLRGPVDHTRPAVFKSVGTAAWDLAAARVAMRHGA